jgi:hypothetical protein
MTWCDAKNAKLIITPGFDRRYTKNHFEDALKTVVQRDPDGNLLKDSTPLINLHSSKYLADLFPWDKMFKPNGHITFIDAVMEQETLDNRQDHFFQFLGKGSPNNWITPCAHPSAKAHDFFANLLHKHITG